MQKPLLYRLMLVATGLVSLCGFDCAGAPGLPNSFTRLKQLPAPKIVASAEAYPGGNYNVGNIIDGKTQTEYSSNGKKAPTPSSNSTSAQQPAWRLFATLTAMTRQPSRPLLVPIARLRPGPSDWRRRGAGAVHPGLPGRTGDEGLPLWH